MHAALSIRTLKNRPVLVAAGVLVLAFLWSFLNPGGRGLHDSKSQIASPVVTSVLTAARPVQVGTVIAAADIRAKTVRGTPPPEAVLSGGAALGRVAARNLAAGDVLRQNDLRDAATLGIAAHVLPGQRAFSIRVNEDEIVGGFMQSGDRVDVFATIPGSVFPAKNVQDIPDRSQTVLLLQNVLVIAVGENLTTGGSVHSSARTVSLSLPPDQLARLALALRFGKVSLAIRKPGDDVLTAAATAELADLVTLRSPAGPASIPIHKPAGGIPVYSGTRLTFSSQSGPP